MARIILADNPSVAMLLERVTQALLGEAKQLAQEGEFQLAISLRDTAANLVHDIQGLPDWEARSYLLDIALGEDEDLDIEPPEDCNLAE